MNDETVYKRDGKGKEIAKQVKAKSLKLRFKNRSININRMISIGRDEHCEICLADDPLVSRRHALIEKEGEHYYVMDKGSTNGTYLNGNPIPKCERVLVVNGDVITVGKTSLVIQ